MNKYHYPQPLATNPMALADKYSMIIQCPIIWQFYVSSYTRVFQQDIPKVILSEKKLYLHWYNCQQFELCAQEVKIF
jgi:hypothetical protein